MPLTPNTHLDERYVLTERVTDCGLGEPWLANDTQQRGRQVVVKLLRPAGEVPDGLQRHLKALRPLRVDGVLSIVNHGHAMGRPFVVHPVFAGVSLGTMLDRARAADAPLSPRLLEGVFDQVLEAVQRVHEAPTPLLHLGLDPDCVLVRAPPGQPAEVKLIDVGLSRWADRDDLAPERSARRLANRAPEQFTDAASTPSVATDVFALGGLLREMLSLPPDLGQTLAVAGLDRRRSDVPSALHEVIRQACQPSVDQRYASVATLRSAVAAAWRSPLPSPLADLAPARSAAPLAPSLPVARTAAPAPPWRPPVEAAPAWPPPVASGEHPLEVTVTSGAGASLLERTLDSSATPSMDQTLVAGGRPRGPVPSPLPTRFALPFSPSPRASGDRLAGDSWVVSAADRPPLPMIAPAPARPPMAAAPIAPPVASAPPSSAKAVVAAGIILFVLVFALVFVLASRHAS